MANLEPRLSHINAADLAAQLAERRADWLPRYYPAGKLRGSMFLIGNADGAPGRSFPIPLRGKVGLVDFGGDFHGDDLALLGRAIGGDMGPPTRKRSASWASPAR